MVKKQENSLVYLEPIEHVYIHRETGEHFTSVTKVISSIEEEFESEKIALAISRQANNQKKEEYIGMTKDQILEYWQQLNDDANVYGTRVHELVEAYLFAGKYPIAKDDFEWDVINAYDELGVDEGKCVYPERIMYSPEYKLAGTADLCIDIDDDWFDIGDWKGLDINTPILTSVGWKTMETINVGDYVYDMNGCLTDVKHTSKIKNVKCYKINFDNGESVICDFEHRWLISFMRDKVFKDKVMTSEELYYYVKELNESKNRWSHKIPKVKITKPLEHQRKILPIDPYVLGVWLGDGHSVDNKITNMNQKVWDEIEKRGYELGEDISQGGSGKAKTRTIFKLRKPLNDLNLLKNKHIPLNYIFSSYEQRLDLLRGFMDADGYYNEKRKRFIMSTTREWQAEDFNKLVSSLGIKTTRIDYKKKFNGKDINVIDICFSTNNVNPFLCRNQDNIIYGKQNNLTFKNIVSIEETESVPTRCIEVGSENSTFLYGHSLSITHNTNKVFNFYSPFGKTLLKPFDHLQECQYSVYSLQLSTYALMYEMETGKKCRQIWIGFWDKKTRKFSHIPVIYLKNEAKKLLEFHKYTNFYM